jgi:uncharacterized protein YqeY
MLRNRLKEALNEAMKSHDGISVATLRLILAALKDRDIADRSKGNLAGITDDEILGMLQGMIRQREESTALYEKAGRLELAEREKAEIEVIQRFLPRQMSDDELAAAVAAVIEEVGAKTLKDVGRVMATLKGRYPGQMDFAKASALVKARLT